MFTQCQKCKAIFRVNLKEVTVAKGKLRCGECYAVFDATKTLSTSMPEPFQEIVDLSTTNPEFLFSRTKSSANNTIDKQTSEHESIKSDHSDPFSRTANRNFLVKKAKTAVKLNKYLLAAIFLLTSLFAFQVLYNMKLKANEEPLHEPDKIQMVSYNVFAHPKEQGVLLISATMENKAKRAQPYPVIEVTLSDSNNQVIALRRFRPSEYLSSHTKKMMLAAQQQSNISLKISDPGSKATRFQYKFY